LEFINQAVYFETMATFLCVLLFSLAICGIFAVNENGVKLFGKYSVDELKTTTDCGGALNWYKNVSVYSNGPYQGTSGNCGSCDYSSAIPVCQYSAFEYAARYFEYNYHIAYSQWKWNTTLNYYNDPCLAYPWPSIVQVYGSPVPGDMIVLFMGSVPTQSSNYHHSAIVTGTNNNYLYVVEQNASPSGGNTYMLPSVQCILRVNSTAIESKQ
jgi:hypothetical protein